MGDYYQDCGREMTAEDLTDVIERSTRSGAKIVVMSPDGETYHRIVNYMSSVNGKELVLYTCNGTPVGTAELPLSERLATFESELETG